MFFTIEHTVYKNTETTENVHSFVFQGIKTIDLIQSFFLSISGVQDTTLEVLLKVIIEHLLLKLKSDNF